MNNKLIILLLIFFISCSNDLHFDSKKWIVKSDIDYPYRDKMINDLLTSNKLKGLNYKQLIDLLGEPNNNMIDTFKIYYQIKIDYKSDIDPVYTKYLILNLNKDSVVINFKIEEYKKE